MALLLPLHLPLLRLLEKLLHCLFYFIFVLFLFILFSTIFLTRRVINYNYLGSAERPPHHVPLFKNNDNKEQEREE
jgi:hypothetical protein